MKEIVESFPLKRGLRIYTKIDKYKPYELRHMIDHEYQIRTIPSMLMRDKVFFEPKRDTAAYTELRQLIGDDETKLTYLKSIFHHADLYRYDSYTIEAENDQPLLQPNFSAGYGRYKIELDRSMSKEEARAFLNEMLDRIYGGDLDEEMQYINSEHNVDIDDESITNTNWGDVFYMYDVYRIISTNSRISNKVYDTLHEEFVEYYDIEFTAKKNKDAQVGHYSYSHVRNWITKLNREIQPLFYC